MFIDFIAAGGCIPYALRWTLSPCLQYPILPTTSTSSPYTTSIYYIHIWLLYPFIRDEGDEGDTTARVLRLGGRWMKW